MGLRLITANTFVLNPHLAEDYDLIAKHKPHVVGVQEYKHGQIPGYKGSPADYHKHPSKGYREVQLFVRDQKKVKGWDRSQGSQLVPDDKFGHDRWIDSVDFEHEGRQVNVLCTHLNAVVQGPEGRPLVESPRTVEYVAHVRLLRQMTLINNGVGVDTFILMDSNYRKHKVGNDWAFSPYNFPGMEYVAHNFDGILYNPRRWALRKSKVIDSKGSDHDFLLGVFDKVGR